MHPRPDLPSGRRYTGPARRALTVPLSWRGLASSAVAAACKYGCPATTWRLPKCWHLFPFSGGGHCTLHTLAAARMCFGQLPIGAAPSQQSCLHWATLNRGALAKHNMQNSTSPARTQTCDRNGRRFTPRGCSTGSCTRACTGLVPTTTAAAAAASPGRARPAPSAAAATSPDAACLAPALQNLCMALTQPCQAA